MAFTEQQLPGALFMVPDTWWGFEALGRTEHPGVCVQYAPAGGRGTVLKGRGVDTARHAERARSVAIDPGENGLSKRTLFALKPRSMPRHRLLLLVPDRYLGHLGASDVQRLRDALDEVRPR